MEQAQQPGLGGRYVRQEMLPNYAKATQHFKSLRLGVIGVGGLGGLCSLLLANAGIGFLRLADADTVALHNLHRQLLFKTSDIGSLKAECATLAIAQRSEASLECFAKKVEASTFDEFAAGLDLILDLSDDWASRLEISKLCLQHKLDLFSGAVSGYTALFTLFLYHDPKFVTEYGCYQCLTQGALINTKVGITGPQAACAASLAAHLVLEYFTGKRNCVGKLIRLDLDNLALQKLTLHRDESCPVCQA